MKIASLDLSWSGPSGWVIWNTEEVDPVQSYGEFTIPSDGGESFKNIELMFYRFNTYMDDIVRRHVPDVFVAEQSDWFQSMARKMSWNEMQSLYARERIVQRRLGWAEMSFVAAMSRLSRKGFFLGVNEARREFGVAGGKFPKKRAAEYLAAEYPRFVFLREAEKNGPFLKDSLTDRLVSADISDAMVLAAVFARRIHQEEMIGLADQE